MGLISARALASLLGRLVSTMQAVLPAKLLLRNLYRDLHSVPSFNHCLTLSAPAVADLDWWFDALLSWNGRHYASAPVDLVMTTDASASGWGAHLSTGQQTRGYWTAEQAARPSNQRELAAVLLALEAFGPTAVKAHHLRIQTDNAVTVAYLTNLGGRGLALDTLTRDIYSRTLALGCTLSCTFLPGVQNSTADALSRLDNDDWRIRPSQARLLFRRLGPCSVDRFADPWNAVLPRFNSRFFHTRAETVDAFSTTWSTDPSFVNAPWRFLPRIFQKLRRDGATATIILPCWPSAPWWPALRQASVGHIDLPPNAFQLGPSGHLEPRRNLKWLVQAHRVRF